MAYPPFCELFRWTLLESESVQRIAIDPPRDGQTIVALERRNRVAALRPDDTVNGATVVAIAGERVLHIGGHRSSAGDRGRFIVVRRRRVRIVGAVVRIVVAVRIAVATVDHDPSAVVPPEVVMVPGMDVSVVPSMGNILRHYDVPRGECTATVVQ